ncbi:FAD-dependent oxidoreductase [Reticulibacter mediterranei]|uniref:FAD-dependent oxidoreductase n=1 Tax=Reticulibacter mediterranei TaxID=2778369 RepID=A0A8J3IZT3_9CHLR|nr:FAD-dependent monooxygenase [Reticulibacter mediterranei]GHP00985.1 FAD-dependent oxidoreductase [Reticulibacter mediterranei]
MTQQHDIYKERVPVIIVGGSLVGLSMSIFLAWHGVRTLVVERHAGISPHPRAAGFNARTLEIYRSVGLEESIRAAEPPSVQNGGVMKAETLVSDTFEWYASNVSEAVGAISPVRGSVIPQMLLEPVLQQRAQESGAEICFNTEFVALEQDSDGVSVVLRDRLTGGQRTVQAHYLIGADGYKSTIRQALDIPAHGPGTISHHLSILFQADVREALRGRKIALCMIENAAVQGMMGFGPDEQSGLLFALYHPQKDEALPQEKACGVELVRAAIGIPDLPVEIISMLPWELAAHLADHFQQRRCFLVGDAAHVMPPVGGFGANTGIQDAHNLAWKLAYVLKGLAGPELLTSYEAERRPVAQWTTEQATARYAERLPSLHLDLFAAPIVDHQTVVLGYRYHSRAIMAEDDHGLYENPGHPSGQPGTRAPHVVLKRGQEQLSTLDLFGRDFVLLTGKEGESWCSAAATVAKQTGIDLEIHQIGNNLLPEDQRWHQAYGVTATGAVIIRPDGFIAWRAKTAMATPEHILKQVFSQILAHDF